MTPSIRKRHLYIWMALAVLLPVGYVAAILAVPPEAPATNVVETIRSQDLPPQYARVLQVAEHPRLKMQLRQDTASQQRQVELILKQPLRRPSTWAYLSEGDSTRIAGKQLLGLLTNQGVYRYALPDSLHPRLLLLYDGIRKQIYAVIPF